jgi:hypothetical protein
MRQQPTPGVMPLSPPPLGGWPLRETLNVSTLPFQLGTALDGVALIPWTLSFIFTPIYNPDDDCNESGRSSIGCQTQSLGEDVPIAGTPFFLHYESSRQSGAGGNPAATGVAAMIGGWTLSVHHAYDVGTNTLFLGDGTQRNGYQLACIMHEKWNSDRIVDRAKHNCDKWQNLT